MPQFVYQGVDKAGKKVSGSIDAASEGEIRMTLRSQGIRPTKLGKAGALNSDIGQMIKGNDTVGLDVLVVFTRQLQVLISSGIPRFPMAAGCSVPSGA